MENHLEESITKEIKKEFQLERMILFSDAVFAIVITLMAIEIRMPHSEGKISDEKFIYNLLHLIPTVIAYAASFFFIGTIWYNHLKIFGHLKTYDKGLVIRNLVLLFFVGLFPFSASLMTTPHGIIPYIVYFSVVVLCITAQIVLFHYILIQRPALRNPGSVAEDVKRLKMSKIIISLLVVCATLAIITQWLIKEPAMKPLGVLWVLPIPLAARILRSRLIPKHPGKAEASS